MAGIEDGDKREFRDVLKSQVKALRSQLDKDKDKFASSSLASGVQGIASAGPTQPAIRRFATQIDERSAGQARIWDGAPGPVGRMPGALPTGPSQEGDAGARRRELRSMAISLGRSFIS